MAYLLTFNHGNKAINVISKESRAELAIRAGFEYLINILTVCDRVEKLQDELYEAKDLSSLVLNTDPIQWDARLRLKDHTVISPLEIAKGDNQHYAVIY